MIDNEAAQSSDISATYYPQADDFSARKAFYDHVRKNFLQQSAIYLRTSLTRGKTAPFAGNTFLVHP